MHRPGPASTTRLALLFLVSGGGALACSGEGASRLRVGTEVPGAQGGGGAAGGASLDRDGGPAGTWAALSVRVEDIDEVTIELVTLACAGDCVDVEAVADGGNPPYAFQWEDGSSNPLRRVCLDDDATLTVSATDTAVDSDEFHYEAQRATTSLSARVLSCPTDAGVDAAVVGPAPDAGSECFERLTNKPACQLTQMNLHELLSVGSLQAGRSYTLPLGGAFPSYAGTMRIWGTDATCTERVLLGEFYYDIFGIRVCLTPQQDHARLLAELIDPGLGSFGYSCLLEGC